MTVREKILALRLLEKQNREPEFARRIGVEIKIIDNKKNSNCNKNMKISGFGGLK